VHGAIVVVADPQIFCSRLDQIPTFGVVPSAGIKGINLAAGVEANGNQVLQVRVERAGGEQPIGDSATLPTGHELRRRNSSAYSAPMDGASASMKPPALGILRLSHLPGTRTGPLSLAWQAA
jgi:hypothetical protein